MTTALRRRWDRVATWASSSTTLVLWLVDIWSWIRPWISLFSNKPQPGVYAGWKCYLSWSWRSIIWAGGWLFWKVPTRARLVSQCPNSSASISIIFMDIMHAYFSQPSQSNHAFYQGLVSGWAYGDIISHFDHSVVVLWVIVLFWYELPPEKSDNRSGGNGNM